MESHEKHYLVLGLRPGAKRKEILSAFRRMAKLYHPDQDASPYAEMRYYEARRAYDALRERADTQPPNSEPAWTRQTTRGHNYPGPGAKKGRTAYGTGWYAHESDGNVDSSDSFSMYGTQGKFKERIPFSFGKIPVIIWHSIKEVADIGMYLRVLLYIAAMMVLFGWLGYGWLISSVTIFCSLFGSAFFRYYFSCIHTTMEKLKVYAYLIGSLLYCTGASFLICMFNPSFSNWYLTALMFCALCLLWAHPIIWMIFFALFLLLVYPLIWLESLRN